MGLPLRHALSQGPVVAALVRTGITAARPRPTTPPEIPTPAISEAVPARPQKLVDDFVRHVGGSPKAWAGQLPPHLFPQWGFPTLVKTLYGVPYDLRKALNGGCRMDLHRPIPMGETLHLRARIVDIDDDGKRALITQKLWTSTRSAPDALECTMRVFVPLSRDKGGPRKEKPRVPADAREIARWRLDTRAGLEFALLTGDVNPIHWITPAARAAGFKNVILHGFSTLARSIEGLNAQVFSGDLSRLTAVDGKFTRPLVLPARPALFVTGERAFAVGTQPDGPCFLEGTYEVRT